MNQSENIDALVTALAAAQTEIDTVERSREVTVQMRSKVEGQQGGKYKFKYATLEAIIYHIRGPLTKNGLWFVQMVSGGQMVTRILHSSGQFLDCGIPMPDAKGSPQDIGSIITYFKRYSLSAAFGIVTEEDDDTNQDEREVSFRGSGRPSPVKEAAKDEAPPMGWGDWARGLIETIKGKESEAELDQLKDANKRWLDNMGEADRFMAKAVREEFRTRRAAVGDRVPF